ncbi:MAG: molybdopterin molybdotransferase MoeA [Pseudomonadota bacterium]
MISVDEAVTIIAKEIKALPTEEVAIEEAVGRTLAAPPRARLTHPPARMSAMDGYAVALTEELKEGATFELRGEAPAGRPFEGTLDNGAVRVFTGSVIPEGANHVIIQEEVDRQSNVIKLTTNQPEARHVRGMGTDFSSGDDILPAGYVVKPIDVALIAAAGITQVTVIKKPVIALFANGDELVAPSDTPGPGQVVNSITLGLKPLLESWGAIVLDLGVARDRKESVKAKFDQASHADLTVPIGGASVGDYDVVKQLGRERFELHFDKVAVKPGKPVWLGGNDQGSILGLPGNPSSAFACSHLFVRLAIEAFLGRPSAALKLERARLIEPVGPNGNRENFLRAVVQHNDQGQLCARVEGRQDTALLSPFAASNALLRRMPGQPASEPGATAEVLLIER